MPLIARLEDQIAGSADQHLVTEERADAPLQDLDPALKLGDPRERTRTVLGALYRWYRETEPMMATVNADRGSVPAVDEFCKQVWDPQFAELASALAAGFGARGRRAERLRALVALALEFWTWRRLDREGLDDDAAADLMTDSVAAVAAATDASQSSAKRRSDHPRHQ